MADIDTDPFGEHESRPEKPTDKNIPLDPCSGHQGLWLPQDYQLGNQHLNKKYHSEAIRPSFAEEDRVKGVDC